MPKDEAIAENMHSDFIVDDDQKAEWALTKIKEIYKERDRLSGICKKQIDFYRDKLTEYQERSEREASYFIGLLGGYFGQVEHRKTKTQEIYDLPSGALRLKLHAPKMDYDETKLTEYLEASAPELIKKTPKWGDYKKRLTIIDGNVIDKETGEAVDFIAITETSPEFVVEVTQDEVPGRISDKELKIS